MARPRRFEGPTFAFGEQLSTVSCPIYRNVSLASISAR